MTTLTCIITRFISTSCNGVTFTCFQLELAKAQWLYFEEGDHFGFSFTNFGVVSYDVDADTHYCDAEVCAIISIITLLSEY